ncbi:MAG: hypothetical protein AABX34_05765 [Nanoarchaeota archaeon]
MEPQKTLKKLKESAVFAEWSKKNPDNFFSYALKILEGKEEQPWQLGFYLKEKDKMASFTINPGNIEMQKEEEVFKKPDMEVNPIDIKNVKLDFNKILEKAELFKKEKYPDELASKTIAILQNLESYGDIWNITFVTFSYNVLNLKLSAETGRVLYSHLESLMDFRQA